MREFKRGISDSFVEALSQLADQDGWWGEVLRDRSLIIGIRDEYLNVYWQGQSLFKVAMSDNRVVASTHPKYLLNPDLSGQISFDAYSGVFSTLPDHAVTSAWEVGTTLSRMKRAAGLYAGDEKKGIHAIAIASDNVVDVEIAVPASEGGGLSAPRLDIAAFEPDGTSVRLVFWEAKTFYNPELRSNGENSVSHQIARYRKILSNADLRNRVVESYRTVARNLVALAARSGGLRSVGEIIERGSVGGNLKLDTSPDINLVVYGFDGAQRDAIWKPLQGTLSEKLGSGRIVAKGDPSRINLASLGER